MEYQDNDRQLRLPFFEEDKYQQLRLFDVLEEKDKNRNENDRKEVREDYKTQGRG